MGVKMTYDKKKIDELLNEINNLKLENNKLKLALKRCKEKESYSVYKNIFQNNTSIMLLIDPCNGSIIDANQAACDFYGYDKAVITNLNISQINTLSKEELFKEMSNSINKIKNQFYFQHRLSNGETRDVEVRSGPTEINGKSYIYSIVYDVTEKNKALKLLEQSESKFKQLFNNINDALFFFKIDEKGLPSKFLEVNNLTCTRLGYSYEEMLNLSPFEIDIHNKKEILEIVNKANKNNTTSFETIHICKDGSRIPVELNTHTFNLFGEKSILTVARDITVRKAFEKILKANLEKQEKIMAFLPDGVFIVDTTKILFVNNYGANLLGYDSPKELIGKDYLSIIHTDYHQSVSERISLINKENKIAPLVEEKYLTKQGNTVDIEVTGVKIPFENDYGFLMVARDISERKKVKKELNERIELEKLRTEFFTNISHELKTPLNVLLGAIQLLSLPYTDNLPVDFQNKLNKYLWIMKQNSYRLLRLVNNLIDLSKVDSGYLNLNITNYNIVSIIEDITLSVADYIENRGLELTFDTDTEERITAFDADKIERIMLNLISNAIKFTNPGDKIIVSIYNTEDSVFISVKDTGVGIPQDKLESIFDRFVQVDKTLARHHEGSGIGLALVKSLINLHDGNISVNSTLGEGSEFILELPVKLVEQNQPVNSLMIDNNIERINIEFSDIYT